MKGKLFTISAPSGAGKTSLARALIANQNDIAMSVSHTTRQQRAGEVDGIDYYFVDQKDFLTMVEAEMFLEYAEVYGNYYGTSRLAVEQELNNGSNMLLDIDWQGARSVRELMSQAVSISILPPSIEELERRLRGRGSDSEDVIRSRMGQVLKELAHFCESDYIVVNDDFNQALDDLILIIGGQGDKIRPLSDDFKTFLNSVAPD